MPYIVNATPYNAIATQYNAIATPYNANVTRSIASAIDHNAIATWFDQKPGLTKFKGHQCRECDRLDQLAVTRTCISAGVRVLVWARSMIACISSGIAAFAEISKNSVKARNRYLMLYVTDSLFLSIFTEQDELR
jgi:hypothetical protein